MLVATYVQPVAASVGFATPEEYTEQLLMHALHTTDWAQYRDQKIVLKGCGTVSTAAYVLATAKLLPHAQKLMYGEPCSMVPLYKRK
jgi:hypothetical protein